jgi:nitroreductase
MTSSLELLTTRRSVPPRLLTDPAPSEDELQTILTIAARVPDHARLVPWRFLVIDRAAAERIGETIVDVFREDHPDAEPAQIALERARLMRAPLVIGVVSRITPDHPKAPEWEQILSAGAVCINVLHAATALGYGANWHTEWYAYDRRVLPTLGVAPEERIAGFIHIGTPAEKPAERPRPDLASIVTRLDLL